MRQRFIAFIFIIFIVGECSCLKLASKYTLRNSVKLAVGSMLGLLLASSVPNFAFAQNNGASDASNAKILAGGASTLQQGTARVGSSFYRSQWHIYLLLNTPATQTPGYYAWHESR